jgi:cell division septation protein DedD
MGLINRNAVLFAAILFLWGGPILIEQVYAQNTAPVQLGTEIQRLEQKLSLAGVSLAERHDNLVRLAQLRQLSGNIKGAASAWIEAAEADTRNSAALTAGAYCLAAIGEWEKAASTLRPLLDSAGQGPVMLHARYLDTFLKARNSSDASALAALARDSEFASLRPMIYYTLWQTIAGTSGISGAGSAESWKSRLLAEFPKSPEARIASGEKNGTTPSVSAVQNPLWLLFPSFAGSTSIATTPTKPSETVKLAEPAKSPATKPPVTTPAVSTVVLQTGLFSKEANAIAQVETLRKAGFMASVSYRLVNGAERWAVIVPAGQDSNKTIQELKKAGFDSFPVKT